jgi:predicted nucleic acid-binding protein
LKVLFDTNLLIASAFMNHPQNKIAAIQVERVFNQEITGFLSTHTIAEFYGVATRYPPSPMPALIAREFLDDTLQYFEIVELNASDYRAVIARVSQLKLVSGAVFDALIAQAGLKAGVDQILTFNPKHFSRLGEDIERLAVTPT